jgi:hypothetical protein
MISPPHHDWLFRRSIEFALPARTNRKASAGTFWDDGSFRQRRRFLATFSAFTRKNMKPWMNLPRIAIELRLQ